MDKHVGEVENATCLELSREHIQQLKERLDCAIATFTEGLVILALNMNTCGVMPAGNCLLNFPSTGVSLRPPAQGYASD